MPAWVRARRGGRFIAPALLILLVGSPLQGQVTRSVTLFGTVRDSEGERVSTAAITLEREQLTGSGRTVVSDAAGEYRATLLVPGRYAVTVSRLGYLTLEREITLTAGEQRRLDLILQLDTVRLEGVVVQGGRAVDRERERFREDPGITARVVGGEMLKTLPGLAEADILRAVELLPGVVSTSDFSSAFNVRGGSADQNLILIDGFPIFNPFHLGGLFSVFNADAIARAELFAGGFGAEYGGRVSSVLNVESRTAAPEGLEVHGGVSLLASRLLVRAPLPAWAGRSLGGERGSWFVSARRSYFDKVLRPLVDFPYHLTDLQARGTLETRGGGRVGITAYLGEDVLDLSDFTPPGDAADSTSILRIRWNWGNRVIGAHWNQPLGDRWTADARLGHSAFSESLGFVDFGDIRFRSGVHQSTLRLDLQRKAFGEGLLRTGFAVERMGFENLGEAGGTVFFDGTGTGVLMSAYGSARFDPAPQWIVEPGLRLDSWTSGGSTHTLISPRAAVKRFFGPDRHAALKLALGRYTQFIHSLRNEDLPVSNDNWIFASADVPAVISDQVQLGYERYWGGWSASAEVYHRAFRGVTDFNLADDPNDPSDDLLIGTGRSYGLDLFLRRSEGRLTGWTSVSLLRAERTLPDPTAAGWEDLPQTVTFPPIYDRRLDVDLVLQWLLPGELELGSRWNFGSPLPYTRPVAQHFVWRYGIQQGLFAPSGSRDPGHPPLAVVLGPRNQERYPNYHRLDVTLRRTFKPRWGSVTPYLQVLNVYNRRNVLFYFYDYDRVPATRSGVSMFPVLPAVGLEVSF